MEGTTKAWEGVPKKSRNNVVLACEGHIHDLAFLTADEHLHKHFQFTFDKNSITTYSMKAEWLKSSMEEPPPTLTS
ncbi:hypothetical protein H072_1005 [Dactylellina haptotyla CBS 200.50]|uniref:Uncharacterized protein n=1 Tax=Dactylellina haptotyla (strain CBS 200.50) TaxID=1284197 RepID=S8AVM2_DACHA|nr:hypothetical protein H072_1005 [Dactylellina haptotyla CBS 200.50]